MTQEKSTNTAIILAVVVAALGYFVDIYDLLLFSMVRVASLRDLGVEESQLLEAGVYLINRQTAGLLLGGVLWGVLGDKRGRISVLFGSILLYSLANLANAYVGYFGSNTLFVYGVLRFIAGVGLAGELGAGITLIAEILPKEKRGYGTTVVAAVGILGAVFGGVLAETFHWTTCYIIGGLMGLGILLLRVGVTESGLFKKLENVSHARGDFFSLFRHRKMFFKYLRVILIGVPIWYVVGILITFSPEFGHAFGMVEIPSAARAVMFCYMGIAAGDLASGLASQLAKNRKKIIFCFIGITLLTTIIHFLVSAQSLGMFYFVCLLMGFGAGYWAMFVTVAAEQFGTNIRSTVTTSAPNFVRGSLIPMTYLFTTFKPSLGVLGSGVAVGVVAFSVALLALWKMEETFHKDLDYLELPQ